MDEKRAVTFAFFSFFLNPQRDTLSYSALVVMAIVISTHSRSYHLVFFFMNKILSNQQYIQQNNFLSQVVLSSGTNLSRIPGTSCKRSSSTCKNIRLTVFLWFKLTCKITTKIPFPKDGRDTIFAYIQGLLRIHFCSNWVIYHSKLSNSRLDGVDQSCNTGNLSSR